MFFKKHGMPEDGELVICTVKKILPHAAFVILDEYENAEAMLHVSEVSSRWVRNIKEHINEGKKIVCKVLQTNKERGLIDVSLKRVTNSEKTKKLNDEKTEIRVEKLIEIIAQKLKQDKIKFLQMMGIKLIEQFGSLIEFYETVKADGTAAISELDIPEPWKTELSNQINDQLAAISVKKSNSFDLSSFLPDGVTKLSEFFSKIISFAAEKKIQLVLHYISAPNYTFDITAKNYKQADMQMKEIIEQMKTLAKQNKLDFAVKEEI
ncbi:MAG: translation initiation factor IF-2 subunit alpha [Candidatus Nanoarchaeia archaeon]|nr:translation initiation factor IF-2 subunit alpha [Candidatus Nanoarchaeia archaeon]